MKTHTYADGFGRWHAITPDTPRAREIAVEAIAEELNQRETHRTADEWREYVKASIATAPAEQPDTLHYIEYKLP